MSAPRILFVDDEPLILQGFRNLLWKKRNEWELVFANGGEQALEEMSRGPFDLVISDMRMPGMDGATLLNEISDRYPRAVRLVLSGQAERSAMLKAIPVAHQYLSKPCDGSTLRAAIERALDLRTTFLDESFRGILGKITQLPSMPQSYLELSEAVADSGYNINLIAEIVQRDPAMSIRVLQLINSACFGSQIQTTSIVEAVRFLGTDLLKGLALMGNFLNAAECNKYEDFCLDRLQSNWIRSSKLARRFLSGSEQAEAAFSATLIRDIGRLILASNLPDQFEESLRETKATGLPAHLVEKKIFGTTHAEIGAYLLSMWGLPLNIVESVALHHTPRQLPKGPAEVLAAVHVAGAITDAWDISDAPIDPAAHLDLEFLQAAGLAEETKRWLALAEEQRNAP